MKLKHATYDRLSNTAKCDDHATNFCPDATANGILGCKSMYNVGKGIPRLVGICVLILDRFIFRIANPGLVALKE